jgi:predicted hydrocarbon binding protein
MVILMIIIGKIIGKTRLEKSSSKCSKYRCTNKADVGGHVHMESDEDRYIIPLCSECNSLAYINTPYKAVKVKAVRAIRDQ